MFSPDDYLTSFDSNLTKPPLPKTRSKTRWQIFEIWYISTYRYLVRINIPSSTRTDLIVMMLAFFCKESTFSHKYSTLLKAKVTELL